MALKVSGSSPGIYPITLKNNWLILREKVLTTNYNIFKVILILNQNSIYRKFFLKKLFLFKNILFYKKFSTLYKLFFKSNSEKNYFRLHLKNFTLSKNNMHFFVKLTNSIVNKKLNIHHSYSNYYYKTSANINILNVNKLFGL